MLRIIVEYSSFKGFCPLSTRWDDSSSFSCKRIHIHLFTFCFLRHLFKCAPNPPNPTQMRCCQSITTKLNMKIFFLKMIMAPIIHKNSCNSFKMWQCENIQIQILWWVFFFLGLKFCPNVKNKYEKRIFDHCFFYKKFIRFAKNKKSCCNISL